MKEYLAHAFTLLESNLTPTDRNLALHLLETGKPYMDENDREKYRMVQEQRKHYRGLFHDHRHNR